MPNIPYDNSALIYLGRWTDYGTSMGSGWQGTQIRFKVSGTLNISVNLDVKDTTTSDVSAVVLNIDGANANLQYATTAAEIYTGAKTVSFTLADTNEHTIIMKLLNYPDRQWTGDGYCRLTSIDIDNGASVIVWDKTSGRRTGVVGDSWTATSNDWPFLMSQDKYWLYPISFGGATASALNSQIDYDNSVTLNTDDPVLDVIVANSSVNDYNASVSLASFNTSFAALVDKLRVQQPDAKIILLQSPRNVGAGKNYDQYGPEMSSIAAARSNVEYIPITSTQWNTYTWSDTAHLDYASRQSLAAYYEEQIDLLIPFSAKSYGYIMY